MRYQFNTMGFHDRVAAGELEIRILSQAKPNLAFADRHGTESQIIQYRVRRTREVLAECHRYIFTSGSRRGQLAASGRPDPKWLLVGNEEWNAAHTDEEGRCEDCATWRPRALAAQ